MTNITELAQSLKAAANTTADAIDRLKAFPGDELIDLSQHEGEQVDIDITTLNEWYELSSPANVLALVEALEKAQAINAAAEKLVRCKGRYHSELNYRALAALFGVKTPDLPPLEHENVHYADAAEMEIAALRQRIAELESRTVKLPDLRQIVSGDRYVWSDGVYNYSQDVKVALAAAGIKVEAE
ncbi:ead/Ea22-like family protein [Klebsiella pneumoniae]|uniref:ead/Ea22-like family protein n=1 Tax=Klebsiella pneumoniae TaxID=573 RepID=UPI000C7C4051|nr:ead/Ea22-like family protein [Klebsiella pneumoniae]